MRHVRTVALAVAVVVTLTSCAANEMYRPPNQSSLSGELNGSGATSQSGASDAWVAAFQMANPDVTINFSPDGSGAGRRAFLTGGVGYAASDSALSPSELAEDFAACAPGTKAIDLPVYVSPIALIFNIDGVNSLNLDAPAIAGIFSGTITRWDDQVLRALNPGETLPRATITAVHRSDDSGTTKNFTDYLAKAAPEIWSAKASDTFPFNRGEAAQGTSGVVGAVTNGRNAIGYADASRAEKLSVASIKVGDTFVPFSVEAAATSVSDSPLISGRAPNDIAIDIDRTTTDASHYPLVLVSYILVCEHYADPAVGTLVKAYVGYLAGPEGQAVAAQSAGAAPLSEPLSARVAEAIGGIR